MDFKDISSVYVNINNCLLKIMIIYKITNLINNKAYIGQSKRPFSRRYNQKWWESHDLSPILKKSTIKNGHANFRVEILFEQKTFNKCLLDELEKHYIKLLNTLNPHGYNLTTGGSAPTHTKEIQQKIAKTRRELFKSGKIKIWNKGVCHSEDTKNKISKSKKGNRAWNKGKMLSVSERKLCQKAQECVKIKRIDPLSNDVVIYDSLREAGRCGFIRHCIVKACKSLNKLHKNFKWEFVA